MPRDLYSAHIGIVGKKIVFKNSDVNFGKVWDENAESVDFDDLAKEVERVTAHIEAMDHGDDRTQALAALIDIRKAVHAKEGPTLIERLKSVSTFLVTAFEETAALTLANLVKISMGG